MHDKSDGNRCVSLMDEFSRSIDISTIVLTSVYVFTPRMFGRWVQRYQRVSLHCFSQDLDNTTPFVTLDTSRDVLWWGLKYYGLLRMSRLLVKLEPGSHLAIRSACEPGNSPQALRPSDRVRQWVHVPAGQLELGQRKETVSGLLSFLLQAALVFGHGDGVPSANAYCMQYNAYWENEFLSRVLLRHG